MITRLHYLGNGVAGIIEVVFGSSGLALAHIRPAHKAVFGERFLLTGYGKETGSRSGGGLRRQRGDSDKALAYPIQLAQTIAMGDELSIRKPWSEEDTVLALYLYFQLPFGKLHSGNPEIQKLAARLDRSSNSVAMKLTNFASLDPKITESGRRGLSGTSKLDRAIYAEFSQNWSALVARAENNWATQIEDSAPARTRLKESRSEYQFEPYEGISTTQTLISQRIGQDFFRRAVLANFEETCCITGIAEPRLLSASHIKPWSKDAANRHNPANGLLLSATLDRAFDRGLITVDRNRRIHVSLQLRESRSDATRDYFQQFEQKTLRSAIRFDPDPAFLNWHNKNCFVDYRSS